MIKQYPNKHTLFNYFIFIDRFKNNIYNYMLWLMSTYFVILRFKNVSQLRGWFKILKPDKSYRFEISVIRTWLTRWDKTLHSTQYRLLILS